jgi:hypothetical protein
MNVQTTRMVRGLAAVVLAASLIAPAVAYAAPPRIYVNKGIKLARLGQSDTAAASRIGRVALKKRDSSYAGQVVWVRYFGAKRGGKYQVEMYSNKSRKVFAFIVNHGTYTTMKGIRIGSSEAALTAAYGSSLKSNPGPVYNRYVLGGRTGTDFYVRGGKVTKIVVRSY